MIRFIKPNMLQRQLKFKGPYLYYYKSEIDEDNLIIIHYIKIFSDQYSNIDILEIDWNDYKKYQPLVKDDEMNVIYLYYDGSVIMRENNPSNQKLTEIFLRSIILFNEKTSKYMNNVGKKSGKLFRKIDDRGNILYERFIPDKRKYQITSIKKSLLKNIIKLPTIDELHINIFCNSSKIDQSRKDKSCNNFYSNNKIIFLPVIELKSLNKEDYNCVEKEEKCILNNHPIYKFDGIKSAQNISKFKKKYILPNFIDIDEKSKIIVKNNFLLKSQKKYRKESKFENYINFNSIKEINMQITHRDEPLDLSMKKL